MAGVSIPNVRSWRVRDVNQWRIILRGLPAWQAGSFLLSDLSAYPLPNSTRNEMRDDVARVESFLLGFLLAHKP
jgi:hypothetical protein